MANLSNCLPHGISAKTVHLVMGEIVFCQYCGAQIEDESNFCTSCGRSQEDDGFQMDGGQECLGATFASLSDTVPEVPAMSKRGRPWLIPAIAVAALALLTLLFVGVWRFGWFALVPQDGPAEATGDATSAQGAPVTVDAEAEGEKKAEEEKGRAEEEKERAEEEKEQAEEEERQTEEKRKAEEEKEKAQALEAEIRNNPFVASYTESSSSLWTDGWSGGSFVSDNVLDNDFSTVWCEGAEGVGVGEWVSINANREQWTSGLKIVSGHPSSEDVYYRNCRCKGIFIQLSDGYEQSFELDDLYAGWQTISFGGNHKTSYIRVRIDSVYRGVDSDTSIAELAAL